MACKTLTPTLYGPPWRVKLTLVNWGSTVTHSTYAEVRRTYSDDLWNGTLIHSWSTTVGLFGTSSPGTSTSRRFVPTICSSACPAAEGDGWPVGSEVHHLVLIQPARR